MFKQFFLTASMLCLAIPNAFASETLELTVGYSQVIGPVAEMSTVIVGDDGVADATLGGGGTIILTGKMLGATNVIVLDEAGRQLFASPVHVVPLDRRPTTNVRVLKGASNAQNYVCGPAPGCTPVAGIATTNNAPTVNGTGNGPTTAPEAPQTEAPASEEQVSLNP